MIASINSVSGTYERPESFVSTFFRNANVVKTYLAFLRADLPSHKEHQRRVYTEGDREAFFTHLERGYNVREAARLANIGFATARLWYRKSKKAEQTAPVATEAQGNGLLSDVRQASGAGAEWEAAVREVPESK